MKPAILFVAWLWLKGQFRALTPRQSLHLQQPVVSQADCCCEARTFNSLVKMGFYNTSFMFSKKKHNEDSSKTSMSWIFVQQNTFIFYKVCFLLPSNKRTNATRSAWAARSWPTSTHVTAAPTTFTNGCQWFLCAIRRSVLNGLSGLGPTTNWWSEFSPGSTVGMWLVKSSFCTKEHLSIPRVPRVFSSP